MLLFSEDLEMHKWSLQDHKENRKNAKVGKQIQPSAEVRLREDGEFTISTLFVLGKSSNARIHSSSLLFCMYRRFTENTLRQRCKWSKQIRKDSQTRVEMEQEVFVRC